MTLISQLTESEIVLGKFILNQYGLNAATVAAPVVLSDLRGIQDITLEPNESIEEIFHQGAGNESLEYITEIKWEGNMIITGGKVSQIATLLGLTLGVSGQYGIPHRMDPYPKGFISRAIYQNDGTTLIGYELLIDIILKNIPLLSGGLDLHNLSIPVKSAWSPYFLIGASPVYDKFAGNGTLDTFTLSDNPVKIEVSASSEELVNDYAFFVKIKESGDVVGTRQTSGFTITPATPNIVFADPPPASSQVEILYCAAV